MKQIIRKLCQSAPTAMCVLLLVGCGNADSPLMTVSSDDFTRVASAIAHRSDQISSDALIRRQTENRQNLLVVDIRPQQQFIAGHIDQAINIALPQLFAGLQQHDIDTDTTLVVYADSGEDGAKAAVLLRIAGYDARFLSGGFDRWQKYIISPQDEAVAPLDDKALTLAQRRVLACTYCDTRNTVFRPPVQVVTPLIPEASPMPSNISRKKAADEGC